MTHPDIERMEATGLRPGEKTTYGTIVRVSCIIDVYEPEGVADPESDAIDDLKHAIERMGGELVEHTIEETEPWT